MRSVSFFRLVGRPSFSRVVRRGKVVHRRGRERSRAPSHSMTFPFRTQRNFTATHLCKREPNHSLTQRYLVQRSHDSFGPALLLLRMHGAPIVSAARRFTFGEITIYADCPARRTLVIQRPPTLIGPAPIGDAYVPGRRLNANAPYRRVPLLSDFSPRCVIRDRVCVCIIGVLHRNVQSPVAAQPMDQTTRQTTLVTRPVARETSRRSIRGVTEEKNGVPLKAVAFLRDESR